MLKREMYLSPKANCAQLGTDFIVKKFIYRKILLHAWNIIMKNWRVKLSPVSHFYTA